MSTSTRFRLNYRQQLAQRGLKNNPLPSLPPWLRSNATPRFDFSLASSPSNRSDLSSLDLPTLHQAQRTMITESRRFNVAVCGRQMGKTTLGIERTARGAADGLQCAWFAPTFKFLEQSWRTLRDILQPVTVAKSEQQHRLDLVGGGSIECWSLEDPDAGRGRRYARIVVDEAAIVRDLERVCSLCNHKRQCARELAAGTAAQHYDDYCPNASTLGTLVNPSAATPADAR